MDPSKLGMHTDGIYQYSVRMEDERKQEEGSNADEKKDSENSSKETSTTLENKSIAQLTEERKKPNWKKMSQRQKN